MSPRTKPTAPGQATEDRGFSQADPNSRWEEARLLYPTYIALSRKFDLAPPPCGDGELPEDELSAEAAQKLAEWLEELDQQIRPHQLRQLFSGSFKVREEPLRALIAHHLEKHSVTADQDKLDFLMAQYFALCAPPAMLSKTLTLEEVAEVLKPILGDVNAPPPSWYEPLGEILEALPQLHSLRDLFESGCIEKGRLLKESGRNQGYDPSAELAFCHFNFVIRRAFIRLMHEDVKALRENLAQLSAAGIATLDCRRAGMSSAEPTEDLISFCNEWKPPLHLDYAQASAARSLEQLLALRADVEEALLKQWTFRSDDSVQIPAAREQAPDELFGVPIAVPGALPAERSPVEIDISDLGIMQSPIDPNDRVKPSLVESSGLEDTPNAADRESTPATAEGAQPVESAAKDAASAATSIFRRTAVAAPSQSELENCLEKIWEQLIETPPGRGRSMATIALGETRFLISSWEVAAFVSESGPYSEDFRRAVVARAMLGTARDACRSAGDSEALQSALTLARNEINYLQGRAEQAKSVKDTETAVNLGITVKRLLSSIEEGERLA
ncbi:MAG: hypothetical protein WBF06_10990 [Candidatus Acidiferrales bacterium]